MRYLFILTLASFTLMIGSTAFAHTGIGGVSGFTAGVSHPLFGLDHFLAMIAVGLWAAQLGGRALWLVPTTFVLVMVLGGILAHLGLNMPAIETGIGLSVIVLGLAITLNLNPPIILSIALVGLFALFHGHAHGAEMPENASGFAYGLGFALATAFLHSVGILLAWSSTRLISSLIIRIGGSAITAIGIVLLAGG
ncbi:MAG: HupE/UreJ family protein [Alphaproteobacteria bacterium]